jgi:hypothetical protein
MSSSTLPATPEGVITLLHRTYPKEPPRLPPTTPADTVLANYWRHVGHREVVDFLLALAAQESSPNDPVL